MAPEQQKESCSGDETGQNRAEPPQIDTDQNQNLLFSPAGVHCDSVCSEGLWGPNCSSSCSCENGGSCAPEDGSCVCACWNQNLRPSSSKTSIAQISCSVLPAACSPGSYGLRCSQPCPQCVHSDAPCHHVTGRCDCLSGFFGSLCNQVCPSGKFGKACAEACACTNNGTCNPLDGSCQCYPGWIGDDCSKRKTDTTQDHMGATLFTSCFWSGLRSIWCSHMHSNQTRVHFRSRSGGPEVRGRLVFTPHQPNPSFWTNGLESCESRLNTAGVNAPSRSAVSLAACPAGSWGPDCLHLCNCHNGAECSAADGECSCSPGWTGLYCTQRTPHTHTHTHTHTQRLSPTSLHSCSAPAMWHAFVVSAISPAGCPSGFYGAQCSEVCRCQNGADCDHISGHCSCRTGFIGPSCELKCPSGTFGYGCQQLCECMNNATCDYVTGTCYCSIGFKGIRCDQAALMMEELNPYTKISPALASERQSAGAVLGIVFLLLLIMAMLVLVVWFRYRYRQREKGQQAPSVSYTPALHIGSTDYSLSGMTDQNRLGLTHDYMKGSLSSTCSLNSENPYATINDQPALCKHAESSYVEMKSPVHHEHATRCCSAAIISGGEPTISAVSGAALLPGYPQNPYDLPRNSHIPSHYDLLPVRPSPTHSITPPLPGSPTSSLL
uniref:EGF-like domain-containing protein n=1 Tax=Poecilia mexicana TaxID=48701 RepID=A0A3B3WUD0_9TELE